MKLDEKFVGHVATLADALKIELSVEAAKQLICEVVPRESLRQKNKKIDELFISVVAKQKKDNIAQFVQVVISDFVLAAFKEACADLTADGQKKVNVIAKAFTCLKAMTSPDDAIVADVLKQFFDLLFVDKAEIEIPLIIFDVLKEDFAQKPAFLPEYFTTNAYKITTASLANTISQLAKLDQAAKDAICDSVIKTASKENFQSVTNSSLLLAFIGLLNRFGRF